MAILLENEEQIKIFVTEYLKAKKRQNPASIFKEVALDNSEIAEVGAQYDFALNQAKVVTQTDKPYYPYMEQVERFRRDNRCYKYVYESKLHEALKVLALGTYGVSLNRDLLPKDYEDCAKTYQTLKETFLTEYTNRLEKIEEQQHGRIN